MEAEGMEDTNHPFLYPSIEVNIVSPRERRLNHD